MQDNHLDGVCKIHGGEFGKLTVDGVGTCTDDIKAESMLISGVFKCMGAIDTGLLQTDGTAEIRSSVRAKKIITDGILTVRDGARIEADEIECDGIIRAGEVSADVIRAEGVINAKEIVGDRICIRSTAGRIARFFCKRFSNIELIEATTVEISGVTAKSVNGKDIIIGPQCQIDTVDCSGTLFIDKSSSVKTITGEYVRKS